MPCKNYSLGIWLQLLWAEAPSFGLVAPMDPLKSVSIARGEWPLEMYIIHVFLFWYFDIWGFADPPLHLYTHTPHLCPFICQWRFKLIPYCPGQFWFHSQQFLLGLPLCLKREPWGSVLRGVGWDCSGPSRPSTAAPCSHLLLGSKTALCPSHYPISPLTSQWKSGSLGGGLFSCS